MKTPTPQFIAATTVALIILAFLVAVLKPSASEETPAQELRAGGRLGELHHLVRGDGGASLTPDDWKLLVKSAASSKPSVRSTAFWTLARVRTPALKTAAKELVHLASVDPDPGIRQSYHELEYTLKTRHEDQPQPGSLIAQAQTLQVD
jgi:hypothetical protein